MTDPRPELAIRPNLRRQVMIANLGLLLLLFVAIAVAAAWLDSDAGHEYIVEQVESLEPENGLRIRLERIDGSIYDVAQISGLELFDPKGRFFKAGEVALDWNPLVWIFNELYISKAAIAKSRLERLPALIDTGEDKPILPDFDIYIGEFRADNIAIAAVVTGEEQHADLHGSADIRAGRVLLNVDAKTTRSGDMIMLALNAEPDRKIFDLDGTINAPQGGIITRMAGIERELVIGLKGEGDWKKWDGELLAQSDDAQLAIISLEARDGIFGYDGALAASLLPGALAQRLAAPRLAVKGKATIEHRLAQLDLSLRSSAITIFAKGGIDLARNSFDAMRVEAQFLQPQLLSANMRAQDLKLVAMLNDKFSVLRYQYLLTAPQLGFGKTMLSRVRVDGAGKRDSRGWSLPVDATFASLTGNGELLTQFASDVSSHADLRLENGRIFGKGGRVKSRAASGTVDILVQLANGQYAIDLDAIANAFPVKGIGLVDIAAKLRFRPADHGLGLNSDIIAKLRRFDNVFLRELAGGLPEIRTGMNLRADGLLGFSDLKISAPALQFAGRGQQVAGTNFSFTGRGKQNVYGPFDLNLTGEIARPHVALVLDDPLPAAGLSAVRLTLSPSAEGFSFIASGGSTLGPFSGDGAIIIAAGSDTQVRVDRLKVSDTLAQGVILPVSGGLSGRLAISGGGIDGDIIFQPGEARQLIRANLTAANARFNGDSPIFIRIGNLDADVLLIDGRSNVNATLQAQGISHGELIIGRIAGNVKLTDGVGSATFSMAGTRGSSFDFQAKAAIKRDSYSLTGNGRFEGRALRLSRPLQLTRDGDGWIVAPTTISYGTGTTRVSGRWSSERSALNLVMARMPLSLIDVAYPDLGLGGTANGSVSLTQAGGQLPVGQAKLQINGLTRSGQILTSTPVNLGLNIAISPRNAAARGVVKSTSGETIGRFQGRVTGLGNGRWRDELSRNPLFAQARFNGGAASLWRLTGIDTIDLTGPLIAAADVSGTLANPQIKGQVRTESARLESPVTGTVVTDIKAYGKFDGSRLILPRFSGVTRGGGTVSGSGSFDFAVAPGAGVGISIDIDAKNAALLARDDFAATITGPLQIRSKAGGGVISGDITVNRSFFRFGRASAVTALPSIKTSEINRRADERPRAAPTGPWRFAIAANIPNRLQVEGLGLDSEWRADLKISGTPDELMLVGDANLVRGNYTFAGRRFQLRRGRIQFVGNKPPNPNLDIEAEANLADLDATINITGSGNQPDIAFNSTPALPQDELLSRMLFGSSIANLSAPEAVQLAAAVASLNGGGGLDPINRLRKAVGLDRLRILPADIASGTGTSIAAGKYITRNAYVELITDGQGYSATRLEFQITRWLSILSTVSTLGRQSANIRISKDY